MALRTLGDGMMTTLAALVLLLLLVTQPRGTGADYVALIEMEGCRGRVEVPYGNTVFTNHTLNWDLTSCATKRPLVTRIAVMTAPPIFSRAVAPGEACKHLGDVLVSTEVPAGGMAATGSVFLTSEDVNVVQLFSRGLALRGADGGVLACGTLLPYTVAPDGATVLDPILTSYARFDGDIVGDYYARRPANWTLTGLGQTTLVYADLYLRDPEDRKLSGNRSIEIARGGRNEPCSDRSKYHIQTLIVTPSSDPSNPRRVHTSIKIYGYGKISMNGSYYSARLLDQPVEEKLKNIRDACARMRPVSPKRATASAGPGRVLTLTQSSPFDPTFMDVKSDGLDKWAVHEFPVRQRTDPDADRCGAIGEVYDPFGTGAGSAGGGNQTSDQFALGDLQTRSATTDPLFRGLNLPLFGSYSVVGRSFAVEDSKNGRRCATINLEGVEMTTAVANFRLNGVYGVMVMRQPKSDCQAETTLFADLAYYNAGESKDHKFHVHETTVGVDCGTTGGHYNPQQVDVANNYDVWCTPATPQRCELGDLSSKHSKLDIGSSLRTAANKLFLTDAYLPLCGDHSVVGRSIVIHAPDGGKPRFACADIVTLTPLTLLAPHFSLTLTQHTEFDVTQVSGRNGSEKLVIHEKSGAGGDDEGGCPADVIGPIYSPFNLPPESSGDDGWQGNYRVGDLIGKRSIDSGADSNLPLHTSLSVSGRTVSNGSSCDTLEPLLSFYPADFVVEAFTVFEYENFKGFLNMKQVLYSDGTTSLTQVAVQVYQPGNDGGGKVSRDHMYHVHVHPVARKNTCDGIAGHFDPYLAKADRTKYADVCSSTNQLACEVGDLSAKHGKLSVSKEDWQFYNDENLPLVGEHTVIGRSIRVHESSNKVINVSHCATILPTPEHTFVACYPLNSTYDRSTFVKAISDEAYVQESRVVPIHRTQMPLKYDDECSCVTFFIAGGIDDWVKDELLAGVETLDPDKKCGVSEGLEWGGRRGGAGALAASLLLLVCSALCSLLLAARP